MTELAFGNNPVAIDPKKKKVLLFGDNPVAAAVKPLAFGDNPVAEPKPEPEQGSTFLDGLSELAGDVGTFFMDAPITALGAVRDFGQDAMGATTDLMKGWVDIARKDPRLLAFNPLGAVGILARDVEVEETPQLPEVKEPRTIGGRFLREAGRFSLSFLPVFSAMKAHGTMKAAVTAGAFSGGLMEPAEENLSAMIQKYPGVRNPITTLLATDPNDPAVVKRFKNSMEMAGLSAAVETLLPALKLLRFGRKSRVGEQVAEDAVRPTFSQRMAATNPAARLTAEDLLAKRGPLPKKAGNINLTKQGLSQQAKRVEVAVSDAAGGFQGPRRGVVSNKETQLLAELANTTSETIAKRGYDSQGMLALRNRLADSSDNLVKMARAAKGGSEADLIAFQEALPTHVVLQAEVSGATAEIGRSLQQFKITAQTEKVRQKLIRDIIESGGGRELIERKAAALADIDDPAAFARMAGKINAATTKDKVTELWINGLLSGIPTHVVNAGSNGLVAAYSIPERLMTAGFSTLEAGARRAVGAAPAAERVYIREAAAKLSGMIRGMKKATVAAYKQFRFEDAPELFSRVSKVEGRYQSISGLKGKLARIPTRALESSDVFFKMINYSGELEALAARDGIKRGLSGEKLRMHVALLLNETPETMAARAWKTAEINTFTRPLREQEGIITAAGRKTQELAQNHALIKAIAPFVRTPVNIFKFTGERTPLGFFMKDMRNALKSPASRNEALAKVVMGTSTAAVAFNAAWEGQITGGGPTDPNERRILRQTGWQPYSIKIGDTYYSLARFEPLGSLVGIAADTAEVAKSGVLSRGEYGKLSGMVMAAFARNATNKTFMRGFTEAISAIDPNNPTGSPERFIEQLVASAATPTFVAQMAKAEDPVIRDVRGIIDRIKSRFPGMSGEVRPLLNLWGETISREGGYANNLLSPVYISKDRNDVVSNEMVRLKVSPSMPGRKIGGVALTPDQYTRYVQLAGRGAKEDLDDLVKSMVWGKMTGIEQEDEIRKTIREWRGEAREDLFTEYPQLFRAVEEQKDKREGLQ